MRPADPQLGDPLARRAPQGLGALAIAPKSVERGCQALRRRIAYQTVAPVLDEFERAARIMSCDGQALGEGALQRWIAVTILIDRSINDGQRAAQDLGLF